MGEAWNFPVGSKLCFVTTGSTAAPFAALLESVLSPPCLDTLREYGFTHLLVQHGCAKVEYDEHANSARLYLKISHAEQTLNIDGFDWNLDGLKAQYKLVHQSRGLVISHAGSGSILEALRFQIPIVVVPNKKLLNNHQEELAVAMEHKNYLVHGDVDDLAAAIKKSEEFRSKLSRFPPIESGTHRETKSFAAIMDETTGFME